MLTETLVTNEETIITPEQADKAKAELMLALCSREFSFALLKQFSFETRNGGYTSHSDRFCKKDAEKLDEMRPWNARADLRDRYDLLRQQENRLKILHNGNYSEHAKALADNFRTPNDPILVAIAWYVAAQTVGAPEDIAWHETIVKNREVLQQTIADTRATIKLVETNENVPGIEKKINEAFAAEDKAVRDFLLKLVNPAQDSTQSINISHRVQRTVSTKSPHTRLRELRQEKLSLPRLEAEPREKRKSPVKKPDKRPSRRLTEIVEIKDKISELIKIFEVELGVIDEAGLRQLVTKTGRKLTINKEMRGEFTYATGSNRANSLTEVTFIMLRESGRTSDEVLSNVPFRMTDKVKIYNRLTSEKNRAKAGLLTLATP